MGNKKRRREYQRLKEERMEAGIEATFDFIHDVFSKTIKIAEKGIVLIYDGGKDGVRRVKHSYNEMKDEIDELSQIINKCMSFFETEKKLIISCYSIIEQSLTKIEQKRILLTYKEKKNLLVQKNHFNSFSEKDTNESNKEIIDNINHLFERTTASIRKKITPQDKNPPSL